ncbi:hypothetical protein [Idiomarina sp. UBA1919]|uniref:hypothetical protein n=2 Tax=unclassified Idiomarina TaxID=2614829 RepID=UPI002580BEA4|nr:hypothetical protein [Idiomarina sp. UBA1919]
MQTYQRPQPFDAITVELTTFTRKREHSAILAKYLQERVEDLRGVQENAIFRALQEKGMARLTARAYQEKIMDAYERYKSCRTVMVFELPMYNVKAFTKEFKQQTFPRLCSYRQPLLAVQERAAGSGKPKGEFWCESLNNDPFFCSMALSSNMWVPRPESATIVQCRVLLPFTTLPELKEFLSKHDGTLISHDTIK